MRIAQKCYICFEGGFVEPFQAVPHGQIVLLCGLCKLKVQTEIAGVVDRQRGREIYFLVQRHDARRSR